MHSAYVYTQPKFGTHVYLTDDATGSMRVIDLNDPKNPKEIARWQTDRAPTRRVLHDIDVRDGMAYLSYWNDGLVILDIGNGKGGSPERAEAGGASSSTISTTCIGSSRRRAARGSFAGRTRRGGTTTTCSWATRSSARRHRGSRSRGWAWARRTVVST